MPFEIPEQPSSGICWCCGGQLTTPAERSIGTHVRCVAYNNERRKASKIKRASYGFTGDNDA